MKNITDLPSVPTDHLVPSTDQLRLAVAAYLARFKGASRYHTESDLRCYLTWCAEHGLDPPTARRPHPELYIRWMQEIRRFKPSTVSRRFSVTAGFYRTCVIDGLLEHSPAEHVRRPSVPPESPTLGFTHLQFEALLTAAQESPSPCYFALVAMLGLLGLRIFEATAADIADLGKEHGHWVLRVCGKGTKIVLLPLSSPSRGEVVELVRPGPRGLGAVTCWSYPADGRALRIIILRSGRTSVRSLARYAQVSAEAAGICATSPGLLRQRLVRPGVEDQWLQLGTVYQRDDLA
jgi:integrase